MNGGKKKRNKISAYLLAAVRLCESRCRAQGEREHESSAAGGLLVCRGDEI